MNNYSLLDIEKSIFILVVKVYNSDDTYSNIMIKENLLSIR
jgi:hypothetical protein